MNKKNFTMVETQTSNTAVNSVLSETQNPLSGGRGALDNSIYISDKAKQKVLNLMQESGVAEDASYFLRVGVVGGGCSGLSYKMDFDNEVKPMDQVFEDKGVKIVCDLKSFLYLVNTELEFSDGLNGKGFYFDNPNASRSCGCGESFAV
jgi:iron-sulfur cluster assembly protein